MKYSKFIFDVGANDGVDGLALAINNKDYFVHAFEANPQLCKNIKVLKSKLEKRKGIRISNYKIHNDYEDIEKDEVINPTFFAGISRFKSSSEYAVYLKSIAENEDGLYKMFASQVFALGNINQLKNENIRLALYFFISALLSELLIIMSMAYSRALPYLL